MRFYLLKYISVNPEFAQGLEEDQEVTQMRQYYISSKKKLKKLFKNIGFDDQLMKIIKGANVNKTIDETLKAQGINKIEPEKTNSAVKKDKPVSAKNLFGQFPEGKPNFNSGQNDKNNVKKKNNLFGNNPQGQPTFEEKQKNQEKVNNLFGVPVSNNKNKDPKIDAKNKERINNLFGSDVTGSNKNNNNDHMSDHAGSSLTKT